MKYLIDGLQANLKETVALHEDLMLRLEEFDPDFNDEWLNDISMAVDSCIAQIENYFEDRIDYHDSSVSSGNSIIVSQPKLDLENNW